jgi:predicted nucleic acid-binding Zn ribbon protein
VKSHWFRRIFAREKSWRLEKTTMMMMMMMIIIIIIIIIIIGFT